jgi:regulator of replication initiation timing
MKEERIVMSKKQTADDPLAQRVHQVVQQVRELRVQVADLQAQVGDLRTELAGSREQLSALDAERGTIRHRVERMLDFING